MQSRPLQPAPRTEAGALARVVFAGIIWGTIPLFLRAADGASVVKVFYRVFFAAVAILLWMAATGTLSEVTGLSRRKLGQVAAQGVLLTLNWVLFLSALDRTSVATAELLGYTGPVFVAVFAPLVTKERFDRRIVVPLALSLGGIIVILAPQGLRIAGPREMLGAALAFGSALTYATLLLRSKKILAGISGMSLMLVEYTVASTILLPFVVWFYARGQGPTTVTAYGALLTLGLVQTAFSGVFFLSGLRRMRTDHAAILTYAEPVSAVLFAAIFLAEPLTGWTLAGGAMVVAGGIVVARLSPRGNREAAPLEMAGVESEADTAASLNTNGHT
ncbi:MAG: DMT family transporter [Coriobacteriia bacterium]